MMELSFEYLNQLSGTIITISSVLAGFSIAIVANLLISTSNTRISKTIMMASILAAAFYLITLFAMTKVFMLTTAGFPIAIKQYDIKFPQYAGTLSFFLGNISLLTIISLAGWSRSKRMGLATTTIGIFTFVLFILFMT